MTTCECGQPAHSDHEIWNGMHHLPVCEPCWMDPENIFIEACVRFVEDDGAKSQGVLTTTLEEALRLELGFREMPYTPELQALCDARYLEWYCATS